MLAEIKGKVNRKNTNLTELREDELTGNFFGSMRYIPFNKGLIFFWEKIPENDNITELDVRMDFPSITIGIEVKYRSGLSSADEEGDESISAENSRNQLSREARVLRFVGADRKKLLLLLADDLACAETVQGTKMIDGVQLGYLSWQEVLIQLKGLTELNNFEQLIVADIIELLEKKGFSRFSGFEMEIPDVSNNDYWGWNTTQMFLLFQDTQDELLENGWRDGPIYVLEILLYDPDGCFETNEPRLEMAKFEYEDIKSFSPGVSPASYYCFSHPLYDLDYEEMEDGTLAAEMPEEITQKYWGVKRVVCEVSLLVDVNYENAYNMIFETFKNLKNK